MYTKFKIRPVFMIVSALSLTSSLSLNAMDTPDPVGKLAQSVSSLSISDSHEKPLFPKESLLGQLSMELQTAIKLYQYPLESGTRNLMIAFQNKGSNGDYSYIRCDFLDSENYSSWEIENADLLKILDEQPEKISQISERMNCHPWGFEAIVTKTFQTYPGNSTFEMCAQWYGS